MRHMMEVVSIRATDCRFDGISIESLSHDRLSARPPQCSTRGAVARTDPIGRSMPGSETPAYCWIPACAGLQTPQSSPCRVAPKPADMTCEIDPANEETKTPKRSKFLKGMVRMR